MAKLYSDATGKIIRFLQEDWEETWLPDAPTETAETLVFDTKTNPIVTNHLNTDGRNCRLSGGVFLYSGVPQTINPPSNQLTDRAGVRAVIVKLFADQVVTAAEFRLVLRFILRKLNAED